MSEHGLDSQYWQLRSDVDLLKSESKRLRDDCDRHDKTLFQRNGVESVMTRLATVEGSVKAMADTGDEIKAIALSATAKINRWTQRSLIGLVTLIGAVITGIVVGVVLWKLGAR